MRKLIVSMNISTDGFMAGPNNELDWHFNCWTQEMAELMCRQLSEADTILLGATTYNMMAQYWPHFANNPSCARDDLAFAALMNSHAKVVCSGRLKNLPWHNSRQIKGKPGKQIARLKQQPGKDIITYGSGMLVSSLIKLNLVDSYILWIHPVILGSGKGLFTKLPKQSKFKVSGIKTFKSGVVMLIYDVMAAIQTNPVF